jgi:hypothetical protein
MAGRPRKKLAEDQEREPAARSLVIGRTAAPEFCLGR